MNDKIPPARIVRTEDQNLYVPSHSVKEHNNKKLKTKHFFGNFQKNNFFQFFVPMLKGHLIISRNIYLKVLQ